jgi:hypothetical protein
MTKKQELKKMHKNGQKRKKYAHRTKDDITRATSIRSSEIPVASDRCAARCGAR